MVKESRESAASVSEAQGNNEPGKNPQDCKVEPKKPVCGLVMPISGIGDCPASHWEDVKYILMDAVSMGGFECRLVSDDDSVGVIQDRIVNNVYGSEIIVCDVSHKNPNVMFELGLRLAFDKAVVIVKDDKTDYSFDTGIIEHIEYPRDLRFTKIEVFKRKLQDKVTSTYLSSLEDGYSPFLKNFGQFRVSKIDNKDVTPSDYLIKEVSRLRTDISRVLNTICHNSNFMNVYDDADIPRRVVKSVVERELRKMLKEKIVAYCNSKSICYDAIDIDEFVDSLPENIKNYNELRILKPIIANILASLTAAE